MKFCWPYPVTSLSFHKVLCGCIKLVLPRLFRESHRDNSEFHFNMFLFICFLRAPSFMLMSFTTTFMLTSSKSTFQYLLTQCWLSLCTIVFMTFEYGIDVTCSNSPNKSIQNCCLQAFSDTLVWCFPWQWFVTARWIFGLLSFYLLIEIFLK